MKLKKRFTLSLKNNMRFIPDKTYMRIYFKSKLHYELDYDNPCTFNEKLQIYKLYYQNPILNSLVDKFAVRSYVEEHIGNDYLVPLYGVYDSVKHLDIAELPEQFVLKCTHDSQSTFVCRDKATFDYEIVKKRLSVALRRNWYWQGREWAYRNVKPRIIAEAYLNETGRETPTDYKFYCFDGRVALVQTDADRFTDHDMQYYSPEWIQRGDINFEVSDREPMPKPMNYDLMVKLSEELSAGFPHVRVDWYNIDGKPFFGEMTFYTGGGFDPFYAKEEQPDRLDRELGQIFNLPNMTPHKT